MSLAYVGEKLLLAFPLLPSLDLLFAMLCSEARK